MYDIASRMAIFLSAQVELEDNKIDSLRYGLELILGEIIKWILVVVIAGLLDVFMQALFAMVSISIFRLVSGGNHCEDYWRCLTLGLLVFIGGGKIGVMASNYLEYLSVLKAIIIGAVVMSVLTYFWAPGEVVYRKIRLEERTPFKIMSLMFLICWTVTTVSFVLPKSSSIAMAGFVAMLFQTISFTPLGYWIIEKFDINLSRIIGERRCHNV